MGYGVLSNDLALPGHLALQLSVITGREVDIDIVADPEVTIEGSLRLLQQRNLWRYDAILLTIGVNNALLLTYVTEHVPTSTRVLGVAVLPIRAIDPLTRLPGWIADRHSTALNRETRRIVASYSRITFVPFSPLATADDIRFCSAATYEHWATLIVTPLGRQLAEEPRHGDMDFSLDEDARQAALDALRIVDTAPEERFDRIVRLASQLFGTASAMTFVDHDRHWTKAQVGWDHDEIRGRARARPSPFGQPTSMRWKTSMPKMTTWSTLACASTPANRSSQVSVSGLACSACSPQTRVSGRRPRASCCGSSPCRCSGSCERPRAG